VDAAILLPPFNFQAAAAGFNELGRTVDYAPELPFSGSVANIAWANAHKATLQKMINPQQSRSFVDTLADFGARVILAQQGKADVLPHVHVRIERKKLEHECDVARRRRQ